MYIIFKQELARQNKVVESIQHFNWLSYIFRGLHQQMRYVSTCLKTSGEPLKLHPFYGR